MSSTDSVAIPIRRRSARRCSPDGTLAPQPESPTNQFVDAD